MEIILITEENHGLEYIIEMINGRMIFNDPENNSVITLNFVYDENKKHQYIYVNTFKESGMSSMYKYKISDGETTNRFLPSHEYNYFIDGYKANIDKYVEYDGTKTINVNHTGEYTIDAILYDEFNNNIQKLYYNKEEEQTNKQNLEGLIFCITGKVKIFKNRIS